MKLVKCRLISRPSCCGPCRKKRFVQWAAPKLRPLKWGSLQTQAGANGSNASRNKILPLGEVEKLAIMNALTELNGDKLMTARMLGIGKTTLYRKLKEYGVTDRWSVSAAS